MSDRRGSDELDSVSHDSALSAAGRRQPRVLAIFAHPDDETICAGGTLAKYASAGAEVRVVSLTDGFGPDGFSGHPDHTAVGAAVTTACYERRSTAPVRLFHCHRPQSRLLLRDRM